MKPKPQPFKGIMTKDKQCSNEPLLTLQSYCSQVKYRSDKTVVSAIQQKVKPSDVRYIYRVLLFNVWSIVGVSVPQQGEAFILQVTMH